MARVEGATSDILLLHFALALGLLVFQTQAAVDESKVRWALRALHTQSIVTQNIPLHRLPSCGSRSSANFFESLPQLAQDAERALAKQQKHSVAGFSLTGTLHLAEQCYNVRTQLELGVRHVHLELHRLGSTVRVCKSQQALCTNLTTVTGDSTACQSILGYSDQGASTGCTTSSPTIESVLQDLADWLGHNTDQVVIVRFHVDALLASIGGCYSYPDINNAISAAIPYRVYSPRDLANFRQSSSSSQTGAKTWPSVKQIISALKNVVFLSSCNFGTQHVHDYSTAQVFDGHLNEYKVSAFKPYPACAESDGSGGQISINDDFTFFYDDRYSADLTIQKGGSASGQLKASHSTGRITLRSAQELMDCQFSPLMAGYGQGAAEGCVWTYRENHTAYCNPGMCTVLSRKPLSASRRSDWYNIDCRSVRYLLCRDEDPLVYGPNAWKLSLRESSYPTSVYLDKPTTLDEFGVSHELCEPGYVFHYPESPLEAGNVLEMLNAGNLTYEVWLGWKSGVTCRQGKETPPPPLTVPKVSSFDCPDVLTEPYILQTTADPATTAAATVPRGTSSGSSTSLSSEQQVGIIVGSLVVFTLFLLLIYYGLYQRMSSAHSLAADYKSTPNGPTLMTRRNVSSLGMNRALSSGFQPLVNDASPTGPMQQPQFPSLTRDLSGHGGLQRNISKASGVSVESASFEPQGRKGSSTTQPPAFPAELTQPPMTRYLSSSSGIPGLTEDEGIVRMNPLFAAQVAGGFGQAEADDDIDGQEAGDDDSVDGGDDYDEPMDPENDAGDHYEAADPENDDGDYDEPMNAVDESEDPYNDDGDYDEPENDAFNAEADHGSEHRDPSTGDGGSNDGRHGRDDDRLSVPEDSAPEPRYTEDIDDAQLEDMPPPPADDVLLLPPTPPAAPAKESDDEQGEVDDGPDVEQYADEPYHEYKSADTAGLLHNMSATPAASDARGVPQDVPLEEQTYGLPMETPVGLMAEGELFY